MIDKDIRCIINLTDGSVAVMIPGDGCESEAQLEALAMQHPMYESHRIGDINHIPMDRTFRNAWSDNGEGNMLAVDIGKAKEIKKNNFRQLRKPLLEALDAKWMRAMEAGNTELAAEIAAKKQLLRDVTKVELPSEVDQLKKYIPDCLKDTE